MKKYYYELYCEKNQVFTGSSENYSLFTVTFKPLKEYCKDEDGSKKVLPEQRELEKMLGDELGKGYHVVGVRRYDSKKELIRDGDIDEKDIINL